MTFKKFGLNESQKNNILKLLQQEISQNNTLEVHHGDCIGADNQFHLICTNLLVNNQYAEIKIVIHPPINNKFRAYCESANICKEKPYLERDKDIVNETDELIVCPKDCRQDLRCGTWSTYRYAQKNNKTTLLFL